METTSALAQQVMTLTGIQTEEEAINQALREYIQHSIQKEILSYAGTGIWEGNLEEMRATR